MTLKEKLEKIQAQCEKDIEKDEHGIRQLGYDPFQRLFYVSSTLALLTPAKPEKAKEPKKAPAKKEPKKS